jgi:hypothetical protein
MGRFLRVSARSRDQLKAHVLIYHYLLPSSAPSLVSNAAPTKSAASGSKGIVPVSPTGITGSVLRNSKN